MHNLDRFGGLCGPLTGLQSVAIVVNQYGEQQLRKKFEFRARERRYGLGAVGGSCGCVAHSETVKPSALHCHCRVFDSINLSLTTVYCTVYNNGALNHTIELLTPRCVSVSVTVPLRVILSICLCALCVLCRVWFVRSFTRPARVWLRTDRARDIGRDIAAAYGANLGLTHGPDTAARRQSAKYVRRASALGGGQPTTLQHPPQQHRPPPHHHIPPAAAYPQVQPLGFVAAQREPASPRAVSALFAMSALLHMVVTAAVGYTSFHVYWVQHGQFVFAMAILLPLLIPIVVVWAQQSIQCVGQLTFVRMGAYVLAVTLAAPPCTLLACLVVPPVAACLRCTRSLRVRLLYGGEGLVALSAVGSMGTAVLLAVMLAYRSFDDSLGGSRVPLRGYGLFGAIAALSACVLHVTITAVFIVQAAAGHRIPAKRYVLCFLADAGALVSKEAHMLRRQWVRRVVVGEVEASHNDDDVGVGARRRTGRAASLLSKGITGLSNGVVPDRVRARVLRRAGTLPCSTSAGVHRLVCAWVDSVSMRYDNIKQLVVGHLHAELSSGTAEMLSLVIAQARELHHVVLAAPAAVPVPQLEPFLKGIGCSKFIHTLDVHSPLTTPGVAALADHCIAPNDVLSALDVSGANVQSWKAARPLLDALRQKVHMRELILSNCAVSSFGCTAVGDLLAHPAASLQCLALANCGVSYLGVQCLQDGLQLTTTLATLDLSTNTFADAGVKLLAQCMLHNSVLETVNLSDVGATDASNSAVESLTAGGPVRRTVLTGCFHKVPKVRRPLRQCVVWEKALTDVARVACAQTKTKAITARVPFRELRVITPPNKVKKSGPAARRSSSCDPDRRRRRRRKRGSKRSSMVMPERRVSVESEAAGAPVGECWVGEEASAADGPAVASSAVTPVEAAPPGSCSPESEALGGALTPNPAVEGRDDVAEPAGPAIRAVEKNGASAEDGAADESVAVVAVVAPGAARPSPPTTSAAAAALEPALEPVVATAVATAAATAAAAAPALDGAQEGSLEHPTPPTRAARRLQRKRDKQHRRFSAEDRPSPHLADHFPKAADGVVVVAFGDDNSPGVVGKTLNRAKATGHKVPTVHQLLQPSFSD